MIIYISVTIITMILASRVVTKQMQDNTYSDTSRQNVVNLIYMAAIFLILTLVSVLRFNTGNDYNGYINKFHDAFYDIHVVTEPGFNIITKLCYWFFGSEVYIVVFGIFAVATTAIFLKAMYRDSKNYFMTFSLFMAFAYYFQSLNTVRYYLALALVLYSVRYVIDKKYLKFVITVLVATCFHKTAIIAIPVFLIASFRFKLWHYITGVLLALTGILFRTQYMSLFLKVYPTYVNEKESLMTGSATLINVIRVLAVVLLAIIFFYIGKSKEKNNIKDSRENNLYFNLNIIALLLYSCFSFVPYLSRIGYYLTICQIYFIPNMVMNIKKERVAKYIKIAVGAGAVLFFAFFLYRAGGEGVRILPYTSWLSKDVSFVDVVEYPFLDLWK